jgi:hypothetical protein
MYAVVPGGHFNTNYIIFLNDEKISKKIFLRNKNMKNLIEHLRTYHLLKQNPQNYLNYLTSMC